MTVFFFSTSNMIFASSQFTIRARLVYFMVFKTTLGSSSLPCKDRLSSKQSICTVTRQNDPLLGLFCTWIVRCAQLRSQNDKGILFPRKSEYHPVCVVCILARSLAKFRVSNLSRSRLITLQNVIFTRNSINGVKNGEGLLRSTCKLSLS